MRDRAVEALESHDFGSFYRIFQVIGSDLDREVSPIEFVMPVGCLDHDLRGVFRNRLTEGGGKFLLEV